MLHRKLWLIAYLLICSGGTLIVGWHVPDLGDRLLYVDEWSEANVARELDGFRTNGVFHDYGLGNVLFGDRYPNRGFAAIFGEERALSVTPSGVYTHYPPGPEYLAYLAALIFGYEPVWHLRILPLMLCGGATVFFGMCVRRRFGATVGWLVMLMSLAVVPFYDAYASIHCLGYAQALLLVELGVAFGSNGVRLPFLALGFAQGWMSFDFFFEVLLVPLVAEVSLPEVTPGYRARTRLAVWRCALAGAGFGLAHLLHFAENWAFFGSFADAIRDLSAAATYRNGVDKMHSLGEYLRTVLAVFTWHVVSLRPVEMPFHETMGPLLDDRFVYRILGLTIGPFWVVVAMVSLLADAWNRMSARPPSPALFPRWCRIGLLGLGVSCLWWVVMPSHAAKHVNLHFRHLNICFVIWATFLAVQLAPTVDRCLHGARKLVTVGFESVWVLVAHVAFQVKKTSG